MKELYSYQEIGTLIDQGEQASFTRHVVARVSVSQPNPNSETVKAIILLSFGQYNITVVEREYEDIAVNERIRCRICSRVVRRRWMASKQRR